MTRLAGIPTAAVFFLTLCLALPAFAQTSPTDARTILQQSVQAMGGTAPATAVATGSVALVEGSLEESGRIRILTRGAGETREEFSTPRGLRGQVFAIGEAATLRDDTRERVSLERAASARTPAFPLPLLVAVLADPDSRFEFVATENLDGVQTFHLRFWNSFASHPALEHLAEFTVKDVWIDATTFRPRKLLYEQRDGGGAAPRIAVGAVFSDYRNVNGLLFPFRIERIFNGTPWATVTLDAVSVGAAVSDGDFTVR